MNTQERTDFGNMSNSQQMNFHQMMKGQPAGGPSADKTKKLPDSLNKMLGQMNTQERTDFGHLSNSQQMNFHQMIKANQGQKGESSSNISSSLEKFRQKNQQGKPPLVPKVTRIDSNASSLQEFAKKKSEYLYL
jgi:hypothetical protein